MEKSNVKSEPAIIFDIDGTLSDPTERLPYITQQEPKNWDRFYDECDKDAPKLPVLSIASMMAVANDHAHVMGGNKMFQPFFCTGRVERVRTKTENWLDWHTHRLWRQAGSEFLLMRPDGDYRPDDVLKKEMLDSIKQRGYYIRCAFDDRQRVVDMWRREGITCFQVEAWEEH